MYEINFSESCNGSVVHNKLHNEYFTTIRLRNEDKWKMGIRYVINYKNKSIKMATIISIVPCSLNDFSDLFYFLDFGMSKKSSIKKMQQIYSLKDADLSIRLFNVLLLKTC
jgi:hypothetical protein